MDTNPEKHIHYNNDTPDEITASLNKLRTPALPDNSKKHFSKITMIYVFLFCVSISGLGIVWGFTTHATEHDIIQQKTPLPPYPFESLSLESKAAIVWDIEKETIIYDQNATTSYPLASITKLMTIYTAYTHAPDILSITITPEDIALEGDQGLFLGEVWNLRDLADFSLVTSSNDGTSAIAHIVGSLSSASNTHALNKNAFIALMNQTASELGLTSMQFHNESGLDDEIQQISGGYGSALDVAKLLDNLLTTYPDSLSRTRDTYMTTTSLSGFAHTGLNTNLSTSKISGLLASKTGFTDLAGGNLAIVFDVGLNRPIAIVVLGSSVEGRFRDVEKLVEKTKTYVTMYEPALQQQEHIETD